MASQKTPESTPEPSGSSQTPAPASTEGDGRTPEERLLARRRLGTAYLEDVRTLIAERDAALRRAERLERGVRERGRLESISGRVFGTIRSGRLPDE